MKSETNFEYQGISIYITPREKEILSLYAIYGNARVIAYKLGISYKTIENHLHNVHNKISISRTFLIIKILFGWLDINPQYFDHIKRVRLTPSEKRILMSLSVCESHQDMARHLIISVGTVNNHLVNIYKKTGLKNMIQAYTYYLLVKNTGDEG